MEKIRPKMLIISVGGTPAPIIKTIDYYHPEIVVFFVSKDSDKDINRIWDELTFKPNCYDFLKTDSAEDINRCYEILYISIPEKMEYYDVSPDELMVDYTGGTKSMTAALVLASIDYAKHFAYVGGEARTKDNKGVVINGKEKFLNTANPWDKLAINVRKRVELLFNSARYRTALDELKLVCDKTSDENRHIYEVLHDLVQGYREWDLFNHKKALHDISRRIKEFGIYIYSKKRNSELDKMLNEIKSNIKFLKNIRNKNLKGKKEKKIYYDHLLRDLISNAIRRAKLENKYDDAVMRLYSVIEKSAKYELDVVYGINNSDVDLSKITDEEYKNYLSRCRDKNDGKIRIGLYQSFELLEKLDNNLGKKFKDNEKKFRDLMQLRNNSFLVHGDNSLSEDTYKKMYSLVMEFTGFKEKDLPRFPTWRF